MPWFNKTLSETTTEDIEVRMCQDQGTSNEDTLLQVIKLYICSITCTNGNFVDVSSNTAVNVLFAISVQNVDP